MATDTSEKNLETILVNYLRDVQGYEEGLSENYNKDYALDTERVKRFILSTQKKKAENTAKIHTLPVFCSKKRHFFYFFIQNY